MPQGDENSGKKLEFGDDSGARDHYPPVEKLQMTDRPGRASDAELCRRARAGDRDAFDELVGRHQDRVYRTCRLFLRDPEDAADAAQEAFLQAYRSLDSLRDAAQAGSWLCGIAIVVCRGNVRRSARRRRLLEENAPASRSDRPPATLEPYWSQLPPDLRLAVGLKYYAGMSHDEAAEAMGVTPAVAKRLVYQGLSTLRTLIGTEVQP
jgi:RNA polymerase sigma-70 factor (ECF subfamily)